MQYGEFVELVGAMRRLQREFFRTRAGDRRPGLIVEAKALEAKVDAAIEDHRGGQGNLFGEEVA